MSRNEADREDLLREATALVERMELSPPDESAPWVVGFRRNGAISLFVGVDPVFQLNANCELRRAYVGGRLVKADGGQLFWLDRKRTDKQTQLLRTAMSAAESSELLRSAREHFDRLEQWLPPSDKALVVGAAPDEATVVACTLEWLRNSPREFVIASSPRVG